MKKKKLFNSFEISKNIISKFSGLALIGQNDSLDVLLMDEFSCDSKRVEMTWPILLALWVLIWLLDINCNLQRKLFSDFCNRHYPPSRRWITKTVLLLFHEVFYVLHSDDFPTLEMSIALSTGLHPVRRTSAVSGLNPANLKIQNLNSTRNAWRCGPPLHPAILNIQFGSTQLACRHTPKSPVNLKTCN